MRMLSKNTIEQWIIPHLSIGSRGFECKVPLVELVEAILYRLKTGCQWRELPTEKFFSETILSWNSVYYHFNSGVRLAVGERFLLIYSEKIDNILTYQDFH